MAKVAPKKKAGTPDDNSSEIPATGVARGTGFESAAEGARTRSEALTSEAARAGRAQAYLLGATDAPHVEACAANALALAGGDRARAAALLAAAEQRVAAPSRPLRLVENGGRP